MKKRVFLRVETDAEERDSILAVDEEDRSFHLDVERGEESYERQFSEGKANCPAAVAFAAFERFCKEECGIKDVNDEVILAEEGPPDSLAEYVELQLACADWVFADFISFNYRNETMHVRRPMTFRRFQRVCTEGLSEPYATRRLYQKYRELIHKDSYTEEELDRMEEYIFSHLDAVYRRRRGRFDPLLRVSNACAAICRSDRTRICRIMEEIAADYPKRRSRKKKEVLREICISVSAGVYYEDEIDWAFEDEEEKKPPLERKKYAVLASLSPEARKTVREIVEEYECWGQKTT